MHPILVFLLYLWSTFTLWLHNIFLTPFENLQVLWILIPVYLGMITAELFQEKHGTSMGNAISNSMIVLWGGIDFLRSTVNGLGSTGFGWLVFWKILIALIILGYGVTVLVAGIRGSAIIKHIGRIREVTYVIVMFAPVYYTTGGLSFKYVLGVVLFFPLFYLVLYLLDRFVPDPKALLADMQEATGGEHAAPSGIGGMKI